jgi:hypothetical protein
MKTTAFFGPSMKGARAKCENDEERWQEDFLRLEGKGNQATRNQVTGYQKGRDKGI